ncbi:penicillin-binding transpeptidase domain-containing protein [Desulforamulus ruminis]|uniref:Peptidoglycan glycosyltransferase n=1 Tax=Desulforamulus ruminis (strain ATCC 23193 / DSM 2154 / NCIMB 8452 / DL) TaxID=696281 RepID=F6DUW2_DESRL|nr:penicillin-binding transpeptidase domain-containing protein [Desulforamulus ruminis]AEG61359.1 Peptidoglycan glycosyltransferase [Desulforamulus ruminis DSM 2154]
MHILKQKRLVHTFFFILILFGALVFHLAFIQLIHGKEYGQRALDQRTLKVSLEDTSRGNILDRQGKIALLGSHQEDRILVFPQIILHKDAVLRTLADILQQDPGEIQGYFTGSPRYLPYALTQEQVSRIRQLKITGLLVERVNFRYGTSPLAAHVIGHLGPISDQGELEHLTGLGGKPYKLTDSIGMSGLEYFYERELKAVEPADQARAHVDVYQNLIAGLGIEVKRHQETGKRDIVTTLDAEIQQIVEQVMDERIQRGAVVVMDARTGDLLAMASRPNFNPADIARSLPGERDTFLDHCTALYQPGSIFKVVVAAAALEEGLVKPSDTFVCLGDKDPLIHCWHKEGHGLITFEEAFAQSCNPAFGSLALKLGSEKIIQYARAFGLESQDIIGYPVPRDNRQNLNLIAQKYSLVNSSIGQGPVLATPVQMAAMINVIVNDGVYIEPRLVKEIRKENGEPLRYYPLGKSRKVISQETSRELKRLLGLVTSEGVGKEADIKGYGSAGKTGSAQVGSGTDKVNAWFSGFTPVDQPRYVVSVLVEEGISGGSSAAPVFREIMEKVLPPSR